MSWQVGDFTIRLSNPLENILLLTVLIIITVAAYFLMVYFRGKRASRFGNLTTLERVHGFKRFHISPMILLVKVLVVSLLFLAATDSIQVGRFQPVADTDYILLIDASPSMSQQDYNPNRLSAAKQISRDWISILPNATRVGLVAFSQDIEITVEPTFEHRRVREAIERIEIDYEKAGTSLDFAIAYAINMLNLTSKNRTLLLFTDGTSTVSNSTIRLAREHDVHIYTFGIGGEDVRTIDIEDVPEELRDDYDMLFGDLSFNFDMLEELARETGGRAYEITSREELAQAFQQVTYEMTRVNLNTHYYILILIALLSIFELIVYAIYGGL